MKVGQTLVLLCAGVLVLLGILWASVTQPLLWPVQAVETPSVDPRRLELHTRMLSENFIPRDWKHVENLDRVAAYIRREFEQAGGTVSDQPYRMDGEIYQNVIGAFGPDSAERVVVGAHYDAFGEFPAADDNASGVAGLIELAHLLGTLSLPMRVELVAFALEEPLFANQRGNFRSEFGGSAIHAESLKRDGVGVRMMFSLEMIGFFSDAENSQGYPMPFLRPFYPPTGDFILIVGKLDQMRAVRSVKKAMRAASTLPVHSINATSSIEGVDWSDHFNYWKQGYPAVMITDTAYNRNRNYHTAQDTADRLDYDRMAMTVQGVYNAVRELLP